MKTLLIFFLMLSGIVLSAQESYSDSICKALFKYEVNDKLMMPYAATAINFYDLSTGKVKEWYWDFGDGNTSREQNPMFIFKHPVSSPNVKINPYRIVTLTILTENCKSFYSIMINIMDGTPYVKPDSCQVWFGYAVNTKIQTFAPALVLDFYPKTLSEVKEWKWDFGDGTGSTDPNPTHIFNWPLVKDSVNGKPYPFRIVTLTIITPEGCIAKWSETIDIYMNTIPPIDTVTHCHAWFKYYRPIDIVTIPEIVPIQFMDASEGKVARRLWKFENGDSSTLEKPLVTFSIFKPTQKVCLTVYTADSCVNTWCETVYISANNPDTGKVIPAGCPYVMRIKSGFPIQMSSCAGWANGQVFLKDSAIKATDYKWSTGVEGQDVKNLCPTSTYTVKAKTADGCVVACTFILNSDGTIKEIPVTWWVNGSRENMYVQYNLNDKNLNAEWKLPDGTLVKTDSVSLNPMFGGSEILDLVVRDSTGNIVYTEKIALKSFLTASRFNRLESFVNLYPNPVREILYIDFSGQKQNKMQVNVVDLSGRLISSQEFNDIPSGYTFGVDVQKLREGVYLCRLVLDNGEVIVRKFIK